MKLTQKRLKELLKYDPETGVFTWLIHCKYKGLVAGCLRKDGHRAIKFAGGYHREHRLAFLYMTGETPKICDHINRIRDDNRWCNLRPATVFENAQNRSINKNNKTGYKGVRYCSILGRFTVGIGFNGKRIFIGNFECKHHAFCEYVLASRKYFGEFSAV